MRLNRLLLIVIATTFWGCSSKDSKEPDASTGCNDNAECINPPGSRCEEDKLEVFARQGICSNEGQCEYSAVEVDCPLGCTDGACEGDPCNNIVCDDPPSGCHEPVGICSGGKCVYLFANGTSCDDKDPCTTDDTCLGGGCQGTPRECETPPADKCEDAATLLSYDPGRCDSDGKCVYSEVTVTCPGGCDLQANVCKGDPCANVSCDSPPGICFADTGTCKNGKCFYEPADGKSCNDNDDCTENDTCSGGKCAGVPKCLVAPPSKCSDLETLVVYSAPGICNSNGKCQFESETVKCAGGCDLQTNACKGDPCANVACDSPPGPHCYSNPGVCSAGQCYYQELVGPCDDEDPCTEKDVCQAGTCSGTPMPCTTPPPPMCSDASEVPVLVTFSSPGKCVASSADVGCQYPQTEQQCLEWCDSELGMCDSPN